MFNFYSKTAIGIASRLLALVASAMLVPQAMAGNPSLSGPSILTVASAGVFKATGLTPNTSVTVAVTTPQGAEAHYGVMVSSDGTLKYKLKSNSPGIYQLRILDSSGKELSMVNINSVP